MHAAGRYGEGDEGLSILDRVISSYTPTLRALLEATNAPATDPAQVDAECRMLVVAVPDAAGQLRKLDAISPDAAACALQAGDDADGTAEADELRARAVELLDQGRGVLLTHRLEARGDLSRLHAHAPALAARFEELRDRRNQQHGA